jgi:hypothetical protein
MPFDHECSSEYADKLESDIDQLEIEAVRMIPCTSMEWVKDSLKMTGLRLTSEAVRCANFDPTVRSKIVLEKFDALLERLGGLELLFRFINSAGIDVTRLRVGEWIVSKRTSMLVKRTTVFENYSEAGLLSGLVKKFPQIAPYLVRIVVGEGPEKLFPEEITHVLK